MVTQLPGGWLAQQACGTPSRHTILPSSLGGVVPSMRSGSRREAGQRSEPRRAGAVPAGAAGGRLLGGAAAGGGAHLPGDVPRAARAGAGRAAALLDARGVRLHTATQTTDRPLRPWLQSLGDLVMTGRWGLGRQAGARLGIAPHADRPAHRVRTPPLYLPSPPAALLVSPGSFLQSALSLSLSLLLRTSLRWCAGRLARRS